MTPRLRIGDIVENERHGFKTCMRARTTNWPVTDVKMIAHRQDERIVHLEVLRRTRQVLLRCPGPTSPGTASGTLTTRLIPRCCDMFSPSETNSRSLGNGLLNGIRVVQLRRDHAIRSKETPCLSYCEAIHACVAGFALKMPFVRDSKKPRVVSTHGSSDKCHGSQGIAGLLIAGRNHPGNLASTTWRRASGV